MFVKHIQRNAHFPLSTVWCQSSCVDYTSKFSCCAPAQMHHMFIQGFLYQPHATLQRKLHSDCTDVLAFIFAVTWSFRAVMVQCPLMAGSSLNLKVNLWKITVIAKNGCICGMWCRIWFVVLKRWWTWLHMERFNSLKDMINAVMFVFLLLIGRFFLISRCFSCMLHCFGFSNSKCDRGHFLLLCSSSL